MPWFEIIVGYVMQWMVTVDYHHPWSLAIFIRSNPFTKEVYFDELKKGTAEMQLGMHTKLKNL